MILEKLSVIQFKNYQEATLDFSPNINCFVGENGVGKTNLLDAVYYLSFCKSFFNPIDSQNIRNGEAFFMVAGEFDLNGKKEKINCGIKKQQKKQFKRNGKAYDRLADHIGMLPLVMVSPSDSSLIMEGSDVRRKFVDGVIAQFDKSYLEQLLTYNKALAQRNSLLKRFVEQRYFDEDSLEVWDATLAQSGGHIFDKRKRFLDEFIPVFQKYHEIISRGKETVTLRYDSKMNEASLDVLLKKELARDRALQYTTVGIHKDDLEFRLSDQPIKKFGSQGQQKSYLLALKLAQFEYIKSIKEVTPLLLLDDVFDKLDAGRVQALMELVSDQNFGQILITDTESSRIAEILEPLKIDYKLFNIKEGSVQEASN